MGEPAVRSPDAPMPVSQVTRYLKYLVEQDELLGALSVQGEVCEFSRSPAGHVYFTIRDTTSQLACVLFRREASQHPTEIANLKKGVAVVVYGYLTVYESRGSCQVYVQRVTVSGDGLQAQRVAQLRARLEKEGLFAAERKRPLPARPRKLVLMTSPGSQAYHDVLHRLRRQYPFVTVIEAGVSVQGDGAADEIALALDIVNRLTVADVILLVRGGGAAEDLAAFNDERLARAIFGSRTPVVTGIGHETDRTIADDVADSRAATPSLAAAAAVPDAAEQVRRAAQLHRHLTVTMGNRLGADRSRWVDANRSLLRASPSNRLRAQRQRVDELQRAAQRAMGIELRTKRARLESLRAQLRALDPLAILARGYAVLTDPASGAVVSQVNEATPGRRLQAQVADGRFDVRVEGE